MSIWSDDLTSYSYYNKLLNKQVHFERPQKPNFPSLNDTNRVSEKTHYVLGCRQSKRLAGSYVNTVNGIPPSVQPGSLISSSPTMVLDDSYIIERDFSKQVMGRVKDFNSIPNLPTILSDKGYADVKLLYLGGFWVMLEFDMVETKSKLMQHTREDKSIHGEENKTVQQHLGEESGDDVSDVKGVTETNFDSNYASHMNYSGDKDKQHSDDPFGLYDILKKKKTYEEECEPSPSLSHPFGFTLEVSEAVKDTVQDIGDSDGNFFKESSSVINAKVMNNFQSVQKEEICDSGQSAATKGGPVLGVLEEVIRVGQAMGYSIEGCEKDIESIIRNQGDDVRSRDERRGSWFNPSSARVFNQFISSSGLVDIKMEGYTFTWSHPSATKMSKLDRFLVSDGIFLEFPSILALCLDRHLSDHHPILLRDVQLDFGPVSFRFIIHGLVFMGLMIWWNVLGVHSRILMGMEAFHDHFEARFKKPITNRLKLNFPFNKRLLHDQAANLKRRVSRDEIRMAVWNCGENKSPGPDGFTFEFFRRYWDFVGSDFCEAVEHFFVNGSFSKGCNSSFVALIPKSAFIAERQILDGPFILNEVLHWCKRKNKKAMFFKVDFAKVYDSIRWDYLIDVLEVFGFGPT
nr:RNA-directed DNA polymerase, eukaryota [Tanacetum cinerariifolium]